MGVYIKGMEMPKDCLHCCFASGCSYCEGYNDHCTFEPDDIKTDWDFAHGVFPGSIPDWCPLVPVPPHGRLIDKDALDIYHREEQAWTDYERNPGNEYLEGVKDGLHEAAKQLSIAPTIIQAEEGE